MQSRMILLVALSALLAVPSHADTVFLKNGRTFEGVIADSSESVVRIRMPGATLSLPVASVERVEKSESPFATFLARRDALRHNPAASAADWLALATWARRNDLPAGAREAALMAADLDPHTPGLAPAMSSLGYVLDKELDRFVPYAESMRRKGLVLSDGQWITPAQHRERLAQREATEALARLERERRAAEARREASLARERRLREEAERQAEVERQTVGIPYTAVIPYAAPVYVMPGYFVPPVLGVPGSVPGPRHPRRDDGFDQPRHIPGSLLPPLQGAHFSNSRSRW